MGTPGPVDSRAVGDPVSADPGSRSGGRRNALEEIDQHIAVDHPLHASHSARSSRIRVVLLIPFPLQAPKARSRPGRCSSASKRATARRTASAREIPRDWHKRAKALTCSSGRSTIVLMMTSSYIAVPKEHKLRSSPHVAGSHCRSIDSLLSQQKQFAKKTSGPRETSRGPLLISRVASSTYFAVFLERAVTAPGGSGG